MSLKKTSMFPHLSSTSGTCSISVSPGCLGIVTLATATKGHSGRTHDLGHQIALGRQGLHCLWRWWRRRDAKILETETPISYQYSIRNKQKPKAVKWAQGYQKRENLVLCLTNIQRWLPAAALEGCHCDQGSCWAKQSAHCPPAATDEFTLARPFFRQNEFSFANGIWSWLWQVPPCKPEASSPCIYAWKALPPPTDVKLKWNPTHNGDLGGFSFFGNSSGMAMVQTLSPSQGSSEYSSAWLLCKVSKVLLMVALRHTRCQQKHPKHATPPEFGLSQTIQNTNLEDYPEIRKLEMLRLRR